MCNRHVSSELFQFFEDSLIDFSAETRLHIEFPHFVLINMHGSATCKQAKRTATTTLQSLTMASYM